MFGQDSEFRAVGRFENPWGDYGVEIEDILKKILLPFLPKSGEGGGAALPP